MQTVQVTAGQRKLGRALSLWEQWKEFKHPCRACWGPVFSSLKFFCRTGEVDPSKRCPHGTIFTLESQKMFSWSQMLGGSLSTVATWLPSAGGQLSPGEKWAERESIHCQELWAASRGGVFTVLGPFAVPILKLNAVRTSSWNRQMYKPPLTVESPARP